MKYNDIEKEVVITKTVKIRYREYNEKRCSPQCNYCYKDDGNYHCNLFKQQVDFGDDDEVNGDYAFVRCDECLELSKELNND